MSKYLKNPKLKGTNIIDCIPQTGECPRQCPECFYNGGRFFRTLDEPWMPSVEEAESKIVRVNSGHDSNVDKDMVLKKTEQYLSKFYNTSVPNFNFQSPVVFTCNGGSKGIVRLAEPTPNLMFVRVRTNSWDLESVDLAVEHYWNKYNVPVVLTFMRYYNGELIPEEAKNDYEWRKSILNEYFCIKQEAVLRIMSKYKGTGVKMCGTPVSSVCADCGNCEHLYWQALRRMEAADIYSQAVKYYEEKDE
jgi:hypothetical protein